MPLDEALPIAKQIVEALEAAHEQGIIHRDLKHANIKVRPDGTVKVLDFGLAKAMEPVGSSPNMSQLQSTTPLAANQVGKSCSAAGAISQPALEFSSPTCHQNGRRWLQTRSAVYSKSS
jgi:serine/threonine-protein kinase